jgi:hypothetical protein
VIALRRHCWRDAEQEAARLTAAERETLKLLIRLPFADVSLLEQIHGLRGGAAIYRRIARLRSAGLVGVLRPPIERGHSPGLFYVTDFGLATVAMAQQADPLDIARRFHVRGADLLGRLLILPLLQASYHLLGVIARSGLGRPRLEVWEQPYCRQFWLPRLKNQLTLEIPACAALGWDDRPAAYFLLPDLGTSHLRAYRPTLHRLHRIRRLTSWFPLLVIAAPSRRAEAWQDLLQDIAQSQRDAPIATWIARWETLTADLEGVAIPDGPREIPARFSVRRFGMQPLDAQSPDALIPQLVGELTRRSNQPRTTVARLAELALRTAPSDSYFLNTVGRHPFLPIDGLATVLGWSTGRTRLRCKELIQRGLVRLLDRSEVAGVPTDLPELTADGLRLVAAELGFPLHRVVLIEGLAGGGPDEAIGRRRNLVRNLAHTLGADAVFTHLYGMARRHTETGGNDEVTAWSGPAACRHGRVRPDGYGAYRRSDRRHHFFLEYDRGTSGIRSLVRKLNAYFEYLETGRFKRDYAWFPDILVVTTSNAAEARFARAARAASVGRYVQLPILLTTEWRIFHDPANQEGLLGRIWREPDAPFDRRRRWIVDKSQTPVGRS